MTNQTKSGGGLSHEKIETNNFLMFVLILLQLSLTNDSPVSC